MLAVRLNHSASREVDRGAVASCGIIVAVQRDSPSPAATQPTTLPPDAAFRGARLRGITTAFDKRFRRTQTQWTSSRPLLLPRLSVRDPRGALLGHAFVAQCLVRLRLLH
jgi:hypothetical protein